MALSGLDIFKHLPKTNCKDCGVPTCLAFAMKVAGGQAGLDDCPHMTDEGKAALSEASAPPQQLVTIGAGDKARALGQETVMFRHEERFHRPAAVGVRISDELDDSAVEERAKAIANLSFERVGTTISLDLAVIHNASGDPARFTEAAKAAAKVSGKALTLVSSNVESLKAAGVALKDERPLLWPTNGSADAAIEVAKELSLPLVLEASGFDEVTALSEKARDAGLKEFMLSPGQVDGPAGLLFLSQTRRAAIQKKFRPLGYPVAMLSLADDPIQAVVDACSYVLKYAAVVVVDVIQPEQILGILTARQDIYTDPQVPAQVEPTLHAIGDPGPDAPLLITTNFALSYYSVEAEVEASRVPAYILPVDTEGTSVLTAWAADKLNAATITEAVKASEVEAKLNHKKMVLPGLVAVLRAGTEDESGWKVMVGPKEATGIVPFLKNQWKP